MESRKASPSWLTAPAWDKGALEEATSVMALFFFSSASIRAIYPGRSEDIAVVFFVAFELEMAFLGEMERVERRALLGEMERPLLRFPVGAAGTEDEEPWGTDMEESGFVFMTRNQKGRSGIE